MAKVKSPKVIKKRQHKPILPDIIKKRKKKRVK